MATTCAHLPLAFLAKQRYRRLILQGQKSLTTQHHNQSRQKSSIPSPHHDVDSPSDIYERALHNANAFDGQYNLTSNDWKSRQMKITKTNFLKPYPRSPPNLIRPTPNYHPKFFPQYAHTGRVGPPSLPHDTVLIHDAPSIVKMRTAATLARKLLDYACSPSVACVLGARTDKIFAGLASLARTRYTTC